MKIGDARYQVSGTPTASASATSDAGPGRDAGEPPRTSRGAVAMTATTTTASAAPIATGTRRSYRALKKVCPKSERKSTVSVPT